MKSSWNILKLFIKEIINWIVAFICGKSLNKCRNMLYAEPLVITYREKQPPEVFCKRNVFLWNLRIFKEHLFWRTSANDCVCIVTLSSCRSSTLDVVLLWIWQNISCPNESLNFYSLWSDLLAWAVLFFSRVKFFFSWAKRLSCGSVFFLVGTRFFLVGQALAN